MLAEGTYRWKKLETVISKTGLVEASVENILRDLEDKDLAREAHFRLIEGQELWGATKLVEQGAGKARKASRRMLVRDFR